MVLIPERSMGGITRNQLAGLPAKTISSGSDYKPDILLYEIGGEKIVLKDYAAKPRVWRALLGIFSIAREAKMLRALNGISGIPRFRGMPDKYSLAMTYLPMRKITTTDPAVKDNVIFFQKLADILAAIHERGIVHLDMKHRTNVMLDDRNEPVVIDFASAFQFRRDWFGAKLLFRILAEADLIALEHWRHKICPGYCENANGLRSQMAKHLRGLWLPRLATDMFLALASKDKRSEIKRRMRRK